MSNIRLRGGEGARVSHSLPSCTRPLDRVLSVHSLYCQLTIPFTGHKPFVCEIETETETEREGCTRGIPIIILPSNMHTVQLKIKKEERNVLVGMLNISIKKQK